MSDTDYDKRFGSGLQGHISAAVRGPAGEERQVTVLIVGVFVVVFNFMGSVRGESGAYLLVALALAAVAWILLRRRKLRAAAHAAVPGVARA